MNLKNVIFFIFICSLNLIITTVSKPLILIQNSLIYFANMFLYFKQTKISSPTTFTFKIYKSTKIKIAMYLIIYTIFSNQPSNIHFCNAGGHYNYPDVSTPTNTRLQLYYLLTIDNLGYIVYSKNMSNNKQAKSYNGNINNNKIIKYMQFNKSNSHFQNFKTKLNQILVENKPDILALSEANIYTSEHLNY